MFAQSSKHSDQAKQPAWPLTSALGKKIKMHKLLAILLSTSFLISCAPAIERYYMPSGNGTLLHSNCMGPEDEFAFHKAKNERVVLSLHVTWGSNELLKIWIPRKHRNTIDWSSLITKIKNLETNEITEIKNITVNFIDGTNYPAFDLVTKYDLYEIEIPIEAENFKLGLFNVKNEGNAYKIPSIKFTKNVGFFIYGLCG